MTAIKNFLTICKVLFATYAMKGMRIILSALVALPVIAAFIDLIIKMIRFSFGYPMPASMDELTKLRLKIQPPDDTPARHGIVPGMTVLEIGNAGDAYTEATASHVGSAGKFYIIDHRPEITGRVTDLINKEHLTNTQVMTVDMQKLPFKNNFFDVIYMIGSFKDLQDTKHVLKELRRVLKKSGSLALSELICDPGYPLAGSLIDKVDKHRFTLKEKIGNFRYYTLIFGKK